MTVGKLVTGTDAPMTAIELSMWGQFRERFGFDIDRVEHAVANGATATARAFGSDVTPEQIIPKFGRTSGPSMKRLAAELSRLPGCHTVFRPKDKTKPILVGKAALAMLDRVDELGPKRPRTLDSRAKPEQPAKRKTLRGD